MKNNLLLFILIVSLQGTNTELNAPDHFGTVSNAMVHSVFGDQSIILLDHELGSAHRVFPENDPYKDHINLLERTKKYIADSPEIFRNQVNEIKLEVFEKRGIVDYVIYRQTYEQVPVYQSRINFRYSNNNLVWFGADTYPNIAIDVHPQIDTKTALLLAEAELEFDLDNDDFLIDEPQLYIYAFSLGDYRLAWRLGLFIHHDDPDLYERSVSNYLVWVDAHSGDIFSIVDRVEEIEIQGSVTAMVKDVPYGMQILRGCKSSTSKG